MSRRIADLVIRLSLGLALLGGAATTPLAAHALRGLGVLEHTNLNVQVARAAAEEIRRDYPGLNLVMLDYGIHNTGALAVEGTLRAIGSLDPQSRLAAEWALGRAAAAFDERRPSAHPVTDRRGRTLACLVVPPAPGFDARAWAVDQVSDRHAMKFLGTDDDRLHAWRMMDHEIGHCLVYLQNIKPPQGLLWPSWHENVAEYYAFARHAGRFGRTGYAARQADLRDAWANSDNNDADPLARAVWSLGNAIRAAEASTAGSGMIQTGRAAFAAALEAANHLALTQAQAAEIHKKARVVAAGS